jgi:cell division protein FtsB
MRIRRSVSRFFGRSVIPAVCTAMVAYFGYYAVLGARGYDALRVTDTELSIENSKLASLHTDRMRLQHRIDLLEPGHVDPDMVEEVAREQLLTSMPGQVAVPRERH